MQAKDAKIGKHYRVLACPPFEYLSIGQVYECTAQGKFTTGFHRPGNGPGTYLTGAGRQWVAVVEVESRP